MLETHATKGNYRDFFVGLTKATVFHSEIMEEPSKGSKKILETTTKFQYSILEQQVILKNDRVWLYPFVLCFYQNNIFSIPR